MISFPIDLRGFAVPLLAFFAATLPSSAVIVAGANGGGNTSNHTTQAQLESVLGAEFANYGNVLNYSDATGIYLGYEALSKDIWVLTARHVTPNSTALVLEGNSYVYQQRVNLAADLALVRYSHASGMVPTMPSVQLAGSPISGGETVIMIGIGRDRIQDATTQATVSDAVTLMSSPDRNGYQWDANRIKRWGISSVDSSNRFGGGDVLEAVTMGSGPSSYSTTLYSTTFNQPLAGEWLTSHQAMGSHGDSGGGSFSWDGSQWVLSGVMSLVGGIDGQPTETSLFGNATGMTDIATYASAIQAVTGTLIPEPSSSAMLITTLSFALLRRKKPSSKHSS